MKLLLGEMLSLMKISHPMSLIQCLCHLQPVKPSLASMPSSIPNFFVSDPILVFFFR
jgi:hypothetical protein